MVSWKEPRIHVRMDALQGTEILLSGDAQRAAKSLPICARIRAQAAHSMRCILDG